MFLNNSNSSSVDMLDLEQEGWLNVTSLLVLDTGEEGAWPLGGVGEGESWPRQELPKQDPLYVVVPMTCVYALILVSGVVGNVSTCVVIARNKHMHTATNYYLFSLAISDLLLLVSGLPPEMYYIWSRYPYVFGEFFCVMTSFLAETSANATVLTITAFTVERYVAICHPFLSYTVSKLSRAVKFIMAIWVLALCLAVPQAIQFGIVMGTTINGTEVPESAQCTLKWELIKHAFHISTCLFFVVPMTLITVLYVLIGLKLRRSRLIKRPSAIGATDHRQPGKSQNHVIRMLVAVVVAFFICWAPFHCQRLLAVYASTADQHSSTFIAIYNALTYVSGILYFLSTTINPLLYHTMSNKFRQAFKSTLAQLCSPNRKGSLQSRTYSMLSRAGGPQTNMGGARTSVSGSTKELPLKMQSFSRQRPSVPVLHDPRSAAMVQPTHFSPVHVIGKKLKLFPHRSGTHMSIDSANTISNSSLQDVDDSEFTGYELVHYMGELNRR